MGNKKIQETKNLGNKKSRKQKIQETKNLGNKNPGNKNMKP